MSDEYSKKQAQDVLRIVKKERPVTIRQIYDALHKTQSFFNRTLNLIARTGTPLPGEDRVLKILQDHGLVSYVPVLVVGLTGERRTYDGN